MQWPFKTPGEIVKSLQCHVLMKLPSLQHPPCGRHCLQAGSSFLFLVTTKPSPKPPPLSPHGLLISPVILTKNDSGWLCVFAAFFMVLSNRIFLSYIVRAYFL